MLLTHTAAGYMPVPNDLATYTWRVVVRSQVAMSSRPSPSKSPMTTFSSWLMANQSLHLSALPGVPYRSTNCEPFDKAT